MAVLVRRTEEAQLTALVASLPPLEGALDHRQLGAVKGHGRERRDQQRVGRSSEVFR
jgi:hypothetical protein